MKNQTKEELKDIIVTLRATVKVYNDHMLATHKLTNEVVRSFNYFRNSLVERDLIKDVEPELVDLTIHLERLHREIIKFD